MDSDTIVLAGLYRGIVTTNADPLQQMRVKLRVPAVFGDDDTDWAKAAQPIGLSQVPDPQEAVWVMFEGGDPDFPVWIGSWKATGTPALLTGSGPGMSLPPGSITDVDLADFSISVTKYADNTHHFNRPVLHNNSPSAGHIAWDAFSIVYESNTYTVPPGSASGAFIWWQYNGGSPGTFQSNTLPSLTTDDLMLFLNDNGIAANAQLAQALNGSLIVPESIFAGSIAANTITGAQIAANSITTTELAANSITATEIAAGAINGQTITGAVIIGGLIETAATGARVMIDAAGAGPDRISWWAGTGNSGEAPMVLYSTYQPISDRYQSYFRSAVDASRTSASFIQLSSSDATAGQALLLLQSNSSSNGVAGGGIIQLAGHVQVGGGNPQGTNYVNVTRTATQSVGANSWSTMNFGAIGNTVADDGTIFAATNQFTSQAAGFYTGKFVASWASSTSGVRMVQWVTQGGSVLATAFLDMTSQLVTTTVGCTFADFLPGGGYYVQAQVFSSIATNTVANSGSTPLAASFCQAA